MGKRILGTIVGIFVAGITVGIIETLGHIIYPTPADIDISNPADLERLMNIIPLGAKIMVIVAWFVGALAGAIVALKITDWNPSAWIVAAFMMAGSAWSLISIPHPLWMVVASMALPPLVAWFSVRLLGTKS